MEVKKYQLMQIGMITVDDANSVVSIYTQPPNSINDTSSMGALKRIKGKEGMTVEEIRLNKNLLKEISIRKK